MTRLPIKPQSFSQRIALSFALLLLGFGALVVLLGRHVATQYELEIQQRLSHGLARHIVEHWPQVSKPAHGQDDRSALNEVLRMLMVVNPAIEVYTLDENGRVREYLGDPGSLQTMQVDIDAVRAFLSGAAMPLLGTDPKSPHERKIFSAAMFPPVLGAASPPGYLYVVLDGQARAQVASALDSRRLWRTATVAGGIGLLLILLVGLLTFRSLTQPLRSLASRMRSFAISGDASVSNPMVERDSKDEVIAISTSFENMAQRIEAHARARAEQQAAHRETIASVAHDLRTPLTALHGYLETLSNAGAAIPTFERARYLNAALGQSDKVRRLAQQLFELARLQSTDQVLQRERFSIDELVNDTVQKFELSARPAPVALYGPSPGRIVVEGDLRLIDRALTNLIDNAIRHAATAQPVRVSVTQQAQRVAVMVEDTGPGLPREIAAKLDSDQPVREPPARRAGGFGGLGLAIAQRIAWLHGGSLRTLPASNGGTRLCFTLPTAAAQEPAATARRVSAGR